MHFRKMLYKTTAAVDDIVVCSSEISAVPWVRNVIAPTGKSKEFIYFFFLVTAENAVHITDIGSIHTYEVIILSVIGFSQLDGSFSTASA